MIPRQFEIGGHLIKVKRRRVVLSDEGERLVGYYMPYQDTILLATWFDKSKLSEEAIEHNFFHELSYVIMIALNDWDFNKDESKIDMMGMMLAQFDKSRK